LSARYAERARYCLWSVCVSESKVKSKKKWIYTALYNALRVSLKHSDMTIVKQGDYLPPTHETYLMLHLRRKASSPFGWGTWLRLPTKGWLSWVDRYKCPTPRIEPGHGHPSQY